MTNTINRTEDVAMNFNDNLSAGLALRGTAAVINPRYLILPEEQRMRRLLGPLHRSRSVAYPSRVARWIILAAATFTLVFPFSPLVQRVAAQSTKTPWTNLTQAQLTAVWFQWLFSIPVSDSPAFDSTGAHSTSGQPYADSGLLFLAGTFVVTGLDNGDVLGQVTRNVSVKTGTALFFPLLNSEWDSVCATPHLGSRQDNCSIFTIVFGVPAMRNLVAPPLDTATDLYSKLTPANASFVPTGLGTGLAFPRLQSPPFSYQLPRSDNLYQTTAGVSVSGTVAPAVADGYYSFIPGVLAPGFYILEFGGKLPNFDGLGHTFREAITYHITVTP